MGARSIPANRPAAVPTCPSIPRLAETRLLIVCLACAGVLGLYPGQARAVVDVAQLSLEELLQVEVVSASKFRQRISQAPSAARVITAEDIRLNGWRTLSEALASLPGLYVLNDRTYDFLGARGLLIPGDYNTRFLLLVDGEPINDNVYEQALVGDEFPLDLALIERIEYVPGPGSSVYGANAMFGVINVLTRTAAALGPGQVAGRLDSEDRRAGRATLTRPLGDAGALTLSATLGRQSGNDLHYPDAAALGLPTRDGTPTPDGIAHGLDRTRNEQVYARLSQGDFSVSLIASRRERRPSSALYGGLFDDDGFRAKDTATLLAARYATRIAGDVEFSGRLSYAQMTYQGRYPYWDGARLINVEDGTGRRWAGEARLLFSRWAGHTVVAGLEFREDVAVHQQGGDLGAAPDFDVNTPDRRWGAYLQDEWVFAPDWRLNAGLRLDHSELHGNRTSPRLGLIWQARPDATLKLLAGRAYRAPNAYESAFGLATGDGSGVYLANPALRPETIETLEAVAEWRPAPGTELVASLFEYRLDDLIAQEVVAGDWQYQNLDNIRARGLEAALRRHFQAGYRLDASLALQAVELADGSRLRNSPRWIGKLALLGPVLGEALKGALELNAVGPRMHDWGGERHRFPLAPIANLALTADRLAPGLELQLRVNNLLDRSYFEPGSDDAPVPRIPGYGRVFALTVRYAF